MSLEKHYEDITEEVISDGEALRKLGSDGPGAVPRAVAAQPEAAPAEEQSKVDMAEFNRQGYELRRAREDREKIERRFEDLLARVQQPAPQAQEEQAPPEPPSIDEDFPGHIAHRIGRLENSIESREQARAYAEQQKVIAGVLHSARVDAADYATKTIGQEAYNDAVEHIIRVETEEIAEAFPHLTSREVDQEVAKRSTQRMYSWATSGRNAGEEVVNYAKRHGFEIPVVSGPGEKPGDPEDRTPPPRANPRDPAAQVAKTRARQSAARTISTVPGTPARAKVSVKQALSMDEDEWESQFRGVSFTELAKGKARI